MSESNCVPAEADHMTREVRWGGEGATKNTQKLDGKKGQGGWQKGKGFNKKKKNRLLKVSRAEKPQTEMKKEIDHETHLKDPERKKRKNANIFS